MIVLDANILVYAYSTTAAEHKAARRYLEAIFAGSEAIGLPLHSVAAFLRIMTHRHARGASFTMQQAVEIVTQWIGLRQVRLLLPGEGHWQILQRMLLEGHATGRLVTDAEIAALTLECGGELQTNDRDFARFPSLRWHNPLQPSNRT